MRFLLAPVGSRGDVQPLLALGLKLREAGHHVALAAPPTFSDWAAHYQLPFSPVGAELRSFLGEHAKNVALHPVLVLPQLAEFFRRSVTDQFRDLRPLVKSFDVVLGAGLQTAAPALAEAAGVQYRAVLYCSQLLNSAAHPPPAFPWLGMPAWANRMTWSGLTRLFEVALGPTVTLERRRLGLRPSESLFHSILGQRPLLACDPEISPVPDDVGLEVVQTGAFQFDEVVRIPPEVRRFLNRRAGASPLYFGLGSMPNPAPNELSQLFCRVARRFNRRAIIQKGWAGLGEGVASSDVLVVDVFPHGELFPHAAAIVHHGGAGTTAAAARAGRPQVLLPYVADQRYWGERLRATGISPGYLPRPKLSFSRLCALVDQAVNDAALGQQARLIGDRLRGRDGLAVAVGELTQARRAAA